MSKISNLAGNAILAKARAMGAGLLTDEDYTSLINCRNVNEVVSYLVQTPFIPKHSRLRQQRLFQSREQSRKFADLITEEFQSSLRLKRR